MSSTSRADWREDFGLARRQPPAFFTGKGELNRTTPQAHLLRRAFDQLSLDGILCADHAPLIYFKRVRRLTPAEVHALQRQFWNHGGAPLLVLVSDDQVHIYSAMVRPVDDPHGREGSPALVAELPRVSSGVRELVTSVESGEIFRRYPRSFDPAHRVDRDLLDNLTSARSRLKATMAHDAPARAIDALLCRLVFACYLFDRAVIGESYLLSMGIASASHLRDVLGIRPRTNAKAALYRLFKKLRDDFNGDLFSDDLDAEASHIVDEQIQILSDFFRATNIETGQRSFWPYDFKVIPIETVSAIYERFLDANGARTGAFYTPRFLAEIVLDVALEGSGSLLGRTYLDPSCGSGIFLVGVFNRIAEEWKQTNPGARNDRRAKELMRLMRESLFGVDISETACRITAFSLYLAYLDQLSPRDIQELQHKGRALPPLVVPRECATEGSRRGNIMHADFFDEDAAFPADVSLIVGNPPWGSTADPRSPAGLWCSKHKKKLPDKQIAAAFMWKAPLHAQKDSRVCFVLPHGVLFNHSSTAVPFQAAWAREHAVDAVLSLVDFQRFLFENAEHPAVIVRYRESPPPSMTQRIEYWAPKADWAATRAEVITIAPQDRASFTVGEWLRDLSGPDAPQIWKQTYWATPRDRRLLERLSQNRRLRDVVAQPHEASSAKRWLMAEGFQPAGATDDPMKCRQISLPSVSFIEASNDALDLFLLPRDCHQRELANVLVRARSNKNTRIFCRPHVLVAKGFNSIAYADFDVSFQHALRGIHGPEEDRDLLIFLAAYLRTSLARYFLFHTSSNWGISRQEVHVAEVLRLPFPLPQEHPEPKRANEIVAEVARIVTSAAGEADADMVDRRGIVRSASEQIEPLVEEYFDVLPMEKLLIDDTCELIIRSARPTRARPLVPTIMPSTVRQREDYSRRVCGMLDAWAKRGKFTVRAHVTASEALGIGMVVLEKVERANPTSQRTSWDVIAGPDPFEGMAADRSAGATTDEVALLNALDHVRRAIPRSHATLDPVRGITIFEGNRLYVVKPLGQRYWTHTAAMNDADEIAGTILMQSPPEGN